MVKISLLDPPHYFIVSIIIEAWKLIYKTAENIVKFTMKLFYLPR